MGILGVYMIIYAYIYIYGMGNVDDKFIGYAIIHWKSYLGYSRIYFLVRNVQGYPRAIKHGSGQYPICIRISH